MSQEEIAELEQRLAEAEKRRSQAEFDVAEKTGLAVAPSMDFTSPQQPEPPQPEPKLEEKKPVEMVTVNVPIPMSVSKLAEQWTAIADKYEALYRSFVPQVRDAINAMLRDLRKQTTEQHDDVSGIIKLLQDLAANVELERATLLKVNAMIDEVKGV